MLYPLIYALGLGLGAHAADNLGSKTVKPWGNYFSSRQLWYIASNRSPTSVHYWSLLYYLFYSYVIDDSCTGGIFFIRIQF